MRGWGDGARIEGGAQEGDALGKGERARARGKEADRNVPDDESGSRA